jgi:DNA (cytosine-5)-methyltransferase 1
LEQRPILLDLFCGAGGCTKGYQDTGFEVVGVDIEPQPNFCGEHLVQMDALLFVSLLLAGESAQDWRLGDVAAIHASPPCPAHSSLNGWSGETTSPDLVPSTRLWLEKTGLPYVIENVPGAPLVNAVQICGQALGLKVRRHRLFEANFPIMVPPCHHPEPPVIVVGGSIGRKVFDPRRKAKAPSFEEAKNVMEMPWARKRQEVVNAVPPAYTRLIGEQLQVHLAVRKAAA